MGAGRGHDVNHVRASFPEQRVQRPEGRRLVFRRERLRAFGFQVVYAHQRARHGDTLQRARVQARHLAGADDRDAHGLSVRLHVSVQRTRLCSGADSAAPVLEYAPPLRVQIGRHAAPVTGALRWWLAFSPDVPASQGNV